eukprot:2966-Rhodomonas_salina.3
MSFAHIPSVCCVTLSVAGEKSIPLTHPGNSQESGPMVRNQRQDPALDYCCFTPELLVLLCFAGSWNSSFAVCCQRGGATERS